jgi:transcriptional regulator with XRE-family HTH domain
MGLGTRIRERRHQQHITQERLADMSDMTVNYLSKIERGVVTNISADKLSKMAAALDTSMDNLLNGRESQSSQNPRPNQNVLEKMLDQLPAQQAEQYAKAFINILDINRHD